MYQSITVIGRLGKDPEMRFTPSGQGVTSFSVATDRSYTDKDGNHAKETTWFKVNAWGKLAETCNTYLQKGKLILVEGRVSVSAYMKDNQPVGSLELTANTVKFLDSKSEEEK